MKKILLSIKPKYVEEILAGRKLVEYRKRIPHDDNVKQVLIYASYPVKRIVAEFFLDGYLVGTPKDLWDKTSAIGGISEETFVNYFNGKYTAYAYQINNITVFEEPRSLSDYRLTKAPQDFCYVED